MVADVVAAGDVVQAVGATRCQHLHGLHPGHPFTTHGQGASPCGRSRLPVVSLARRRPCSLVLPHGSPQRPRGRHLPVGTRQPWPNFFSTMALTPLVGPEWVTDFGATYHTTPNLGILFFCSPSVFLSSFVHYGRKWVVSSCHICGCRRPHGSFCLPDVFVTPSMVHNLLSICHFTADNSCSLEFDSFGPTMKNLASRCPVL